MANAIQPTALPAVPLGIKGDSGSVSTTPCASTAKGGTFSTGSFIAGILTGLVLAGLTHLVSGKGKRSNGSRSAQPEPHEEPNLLPPPSPAVNAHDNDGCTVREPTPAPTGQRKLTDEDVETIRAMKAAGKSVKEIATLYGVSPKTIYARTRPKKNSNHQKQNESQDE